jgi:hypothetical protein
MDVGSVDIAATGIAMKQAQVQQKIDIAVMKNVMDTHTEIAQMLINDLMQVNVSAASGHIDIST